MIITISIIYLIASTMSTYLWQNFLTDSSILNRIKETIQKLIEEYTITHLIEIGPGRWALTKKIVQLPVEILCIEKDTTMDHYLASLTKHHKNLHIHYQDVLEFNEKQIMHQKKHLIVGNLPYYITSPILRKFFWSTQALRWGGVFLIQKEVAEKIVATAPKKSFLRWLINYAYRVEYCFSVPPKAFNPPPKVTSAVIRLSPKKNDDIPTLSYENMLIFLDQYSPYKRKTLWASSKIVAKLAKKRDSDEVMFDITPFAEKRLEELWWEEMDKILK